MENKRGILLIALGSVHYGRMAANVAASIRYGNKNVDIHLVHSGGSISHLSDAHKSLFTSMSECPPEFYTKNGKTVYLKAKTFAYDLSPFDETILIDVDLVCFAKEPQDSSLFDALKDVKLRCKTRGIAIKVSYCK